jgi:Ca-activated chloride channel homolog
VTLLYPLGLLGLLTLPVILAIHMLKERKRTYTVSSLELWSFLEVEVRGQKLRRIPISWLLLIDLLIAVLLSLAWAQPSLDLPIPGRSARHAIILLDTSTSMLASDPLPTRFSHASQEAISLINDLGPRDVATLITFGSKARLLGDTRVNSLPDLLDQIESLRAGETGNCLPSAIALAEAAADDELPAEIFVLTDAAYADPGVNPSLPVHWRVYGTGTPNQAVLDLHATSTGPENYQVFARLANFAGEPSSRLVTLIADGVPLHSSTIEIPPDSVISQVWPVVTGKPSTISAILAGNDGLSPDDSASIGWNTGGEIRVVIVQDAERASRVNAQVEKALRSIPEVGLRMVEIEEYSPLDPSDLAIFIGVLPSAWPAGNVLALDPPPGNPLLPLQEQADPLIPPLLTNGEAPVLAGVDFSGVRWGMKRTLQEMPPQAEILAQTKESPIYLLSQSGSTRLYIFLPDLQEGNLIRHPAFPLMLGNLVQEARQTPFPQMVAAGDSIQLPNPEQYLTLTITSPSGHPLTLAGHWPESWEETREAGIYHFELIEKSGKKVDHFVAVNPGDRVESQLAPQAWSKGNAQSSPSFTQEIDGQLELMPWLLGLAVLLLLLEALISWR